MPPFILPDLHRPWSVGSVQLTAEGVLYTVDLRLRPEGKAGSIATSIDRLETYFAHDAWVWEKLA